MKNCRAILDHPEHHHLEKEHPPHSPQQHAPPRPPLHPIHNLPEEKGQQSRWENLKARVSIGKPARTKWCESEFFLEPAQCSSVILISVSDGSRSRKGCVPFRAMPVAGRDGGDGGVHVGHDHKTWLSMTKNGKKAFFRRQNGVLTAFYRRKNVLFRSVFPMETGREGERGSWATCVSSKETGPVKSFTDWHSKISRRSPERDGDIWSGHGHRTCHSVVKNGKMAFFRR